MTVEVDLPKGEANVVYRTTDGGNTWTYSK